MDNFENFDRVALAEPTYGREMISSLKSDLTGDCVVLCAPEAWEHVKDEFPKKPKAVAVPQSMDKSAIEKQVVDMPEAEVVFGIGGGSAVDAAKMYAFKRDKRLVLAPSILSVDAAFTKEIAVRIDDKVRYLGPVVPEKLLIDFDLLEKAPPALNRAGVGDVLSIYTALYDWKLADDVKGENYDEEKAEQAGQLLKLLVGGAKDIYESMEDGLKLLAELYYSEVNICEEAGSSRPEEGSEHYLAYCLESMTKRRFIHGELVAMGVIFATIYQCRPVKNIVEFLNTAGVEYRPKRIGTSYEEIKQALLYLPKYLEEESHLPYGIFHHRGMDEAAADELIKYYRIETCDE